MTLSPEEKKSLSRYRLEKAQRFLDDARLLLDEGRWESSINRSYYAALHAAKSVLILMGIDPKTHEGVKTMVNKNLVLEGLLPKESGRWFRDLLFEREEADYTDYVSIDQSDADEAHKNASMFLQQIKEVIGRLMPQL